MWVASGPGSGRGGSQADVRRRAAVEQAGACAEDRGHEVQASLLKCAGLGHAAIDQDASDSLGDSTANAARTDSYTQTLFDRSC